MEQQLERNAVKDCQAGDNGCRACGEPVGEKHAVGCDADIAQIGKDPVREDDDLLHQVKKSLSRPYATSARRRAKLIDRLIARFQEMFYASRIALEWFHTFGYERGGPHARGEDVVALLEDAVDESERSVVGRLRRNRDSWKRTAEEGMKAVDRLSDLHDEATDDRYQLIQRVDDLEKIRDEALQYVTGAINLLECDEYDAARNDMEMALITLTDTEGGNDVIDLDNLTPEWIRDYVATEPTVEEDEIPEADKQILLACADKIERLEDELSDDS